MSGFGTNRVWLRLESLDERAMPDANQYQPIGAEPLPLPVQSAPTTPPPTIPPITDGEPSLPKLREWAAIDFQAAANKYQLEIKITTTDGTTHTYGPVSISTLSGKTARDLVHGDLVDRGWSVEKVGDTGLKIFVVGNSPIRSIAPFNFSNAESTVPNPQISRSGGVTELLPAPREMK